MIGRVTRVQPNRYRLTLRRSEVLVLLTLVRQMRVQLGTSTDDPLVRRLFPPAYQDDPERDAGYQVLARDELVDQKLEALNIVERTLGVDPPGGDAIEDLEVKRVLKAEVSHEALTAWMQVLNSLRLVLGTRLDVTEDLHEIDADDPNAPDFAVYDFLGWLVSQIVDALDEDLPPPTEDIHIPGL